MSGSGTRHFQNLREDGLQPKAHRIILTFDKHSKMKREKTMKTNMAEQILQ